MRIWNDTPLWGDVNGTFHVLSNCAQRKGSSIRNTLAAKVDKNKICLACVERMKEIPEGRTHEGEPII